MKFEKFTWKSRNWIAKPLRLCFASEYFSKQWCDYGKRLTTRWFTTGIKYV